MVTIKANQRKLHDQVKALPWSKVPIGAQTRDTGHGRKETRTVKALTVATPGGLGFPRAEQAVRITRTRTIKGKTGRETAYLTISLPAGQARPGPSIWAPGRVGNGISRIACITYETSRFMKTRIKPGPATAPPCSPPYLSTELTLTFLLVSGLYGEVSLIRAWAKQRGISRFWSRR